MFGNFHIKKVFINFWFFFHCFFIIPIFRAILYCLNKFPSRWKSYWYYKNYYISLYSWYYRYCIYLSFKGTWLNIKSSFAYTCIVKRRFVFQIHISVSSKILIYPLNNIILYENHNIYLILYYLYFKLL